MLDRLCVLEGEREYNCMIVKSNLTDAVIEIEKEIQEKYARWAK